jgi:hypothetical protein
LASNAKPEPCSHAAGEGLSRLLRLTSCAAHLRLDRPTCVSSRAAPRALPSSAWTAR